MLVMPHVTESSGLVIFLQTESGKFIALISMPNPRKGDANKVFTLTEKFVSTQYCLSHVYLFLLFIFAILSLRLIFENQRDI